MINQWKGAWGSFRWWKLVLMIYVCVIYGNSLTPAVISSTGSSFVLEQLKGVFEMVGWNSRWLTEHMVRKTAHFVEYAGLGALLVLSFKTWIVSEESRLRTAWELAFLIPFVDETIQLFVPGRSGQVDDVWLDVCGAVLTLVIGTYLIRGLGKGGGKPLRKGSQVTGK